MKESISTAQRIIVFIIFIAALFTFSIYALNISAEIKRQKIQKMESKIAELQKEVQELRRRAEEVIKQEKEIKKREQKQEKEIISDDGVVLRATDLEKWYKTKDKAVKEIQRMYGGRINLACKKHGIDPKIITAVIAVESSGNYMSVSKSNAQGLMQLKPKTAKLMGIKDPFHPYENIWAGARYLKQLKKRFGDLDTALAAYNMGPTAVAKLLKNNFNPSAYIYARKVNLVLAKI